MKEYNRLVVRVELQEDSLELRNIYRELSKSCEELIFAIPDRWIYARIHGNDSGYNPDHIREMWMDYRWVSNVVILDRNHMTLESLYSICRFDAIIYGSEYGKSFINDSLFAAQNDIKMISNIQQTYTNYDRLDALEIALNDVPRSKKIVLFGTGKYFEIYMSKYGKKHIPAYAVDNEKSKWGTYKNNIEIKPPTELFSESTNDVLVILCAKNYAAIKEQLLTNGLFDYRPLLYDNKLALLEEFLVAAEHEKEYMDKAMPVLNKLMFEFDRVCRKYNLKYYVISGSLIGVVRHQGMIPWDDDIDVGMPRADLERLKEIASKEWNGEEFLFLDYKDLGNNTFLDVMPRLYYMKERFPTKIMDKARDNITADVADTLILDVYPMDNASDNDLKHSFNMFRIKGYYNLLMGHRASMDYNEYARLPKWKINIMKFVHSLGSKISFRWLVKRIESVIQCENEHETARYFMSSGPIYYVERTYDKKFFDEGIRMPFNKFDVNVPKDYDGLLHAEMYGNYMEYPPYAVRKPSHYFNADISIW